MYLSTFVAGNSTLTGAGMDLSATFGATLIGSSLSFVIWGIICTQVFIYFSSYPHDSALAQFLIFAVWAMDTARLLLEFIALWKPLIRQWGNVAAIQNYPHTMLHSDWLGASVIIVVQFFFLWRINALGGYHRWKWVVIAFVIVAGIFQFAATVFFDARGLRGNTLATENSPLLKRLQLADRTCTAAIDTIICISLVKLLLQNGIPAYSRTRQLLYRSIIVTVNTGMWTALFSIIDLVLMGAEPKNFWYCVIELPVQSLYVVTLLSNLCARSYISGKPTEWDEYLSTLPEDSSTRKAVDQAAMGSTFSDKLSRCPNTMSSQASSSVVSTEIAFAKPGTVDYQQDCYDRRPRYTPSTV